jgi:hypothetical protein
MIHNKTNKKNLPGDIAMKLLGKWIVAMQFFCSFKKNTTRVLCVTRYASHKIGLCNT